MRKEVVINPETGRPDLNLTKLETGDYCGPISNYTGNVPAVFFKLPVSDDHPDAGLRHICMPPHTIIEEEDGTLTIQPSILAVRKQEGEDPPPWHGYLTKGEWSVC